MIYFPETYTFYFILLEELLTYLDEKKIFLIIYEYI